MEFIQVRSSAKIQIQSYNQHSLQINNKNFTHSLIALPDELILDWPVKSITQLTIETCKVFFEHHFDVLLIGTGKDLIFPHLQMLNYLRSQGRGIEFMSTGAACRTFQILTAENRKVAAALIISS